MNRLLLSLAGVMLAATSLFAQVESSVAGYRCGPVRGAVPGATVSLQLVGSATSLFTTKTSATGAFQIAAVPANTYDLSVEVKGFQKLVVSKLVVEPSRVVDVQALKLAIAAPPKQWK
ncbi:MAG: carboxypeptidase-like regulatory domain-containing protein [Ignavibacteriota bacterium]